MDPKIEFYMAAFFQKGNGFDFEVFKGTSRYQYGHGLGDAFCGIVRHIPKVTKFLKPMAIKAIPTLLKAGSEAIKDGAPVKGVI